MGQQIRQYSGQISILVPKIRCTLLDLYKTSHENYDRNYCDQPPSPTTRKFWSNNQATQYDMENRYIAAKTVATFDVLTATQMCVM